MDRLEVYISTLPATTTKTELAQFIKRQSGVVVSSSDIVFRSAGKRTKVIFAFIRNCTFEDCDQLCQANGCTWESNSQPLRIEIARIRDDLSGRNADDSQSKEGLTRRVQSIKKKSSWKQDSVFVPATAAISTNNNSIEINKIQTQPSNFNSNTTTTSTFKPPGISSTLNLIARTLQHPPSNPRNDTRYAHTQFHSFALAVSQVSVQYAPSIGYSRKELENWIRESWIERLPFDFGFQGSSSKVAKGAPLNWRVERCRHFPPRMGLAPESFCWGRRCAFAHAPFEHRDYGALRYPYIRHDISWQVFDQEVRSGVDRKRNPVGVRREDNSSIYSNGNSPSLMESGSTILEILGLSSELLDNFIRPISTPRSLSFDRTLPAAFKFNSILSDDASLAISIIQSNSRVPQHLRMQYEDFLKSCLKVGGKKDFWLEGLEMITDFSRQNMEFAKLVESMSFEGEEGGFEHKRRKIGW